MKWGVPLGATPPPHLTLGPKIFLCKHQQILNYNFSKSPGIAPKILVICSVIGMKCRARGLGPQAFHGFTEKTDWVKNIIEVCGIYAKCLNNQKLRFVNVFDIRGKA